MLSLHSSLKLPALFVLTTCLLLSVQPAQAHAPIEGVDSFVNGILHPLIIPAQVLLIISLGLLVGKQGGKAIKTALPLFLFSALIGASLSLLGHAISEMLLLSSTLLLALWVIIHKPTTTLPLYVITGLVALLIGMDSLIDSFEGNDRYIALLGSGTGSYLLLIYVSGIAERVTAWKNGIVLRVAGSWLAASASMVFALKLAGLT